jgi:hypothetical protein
MRRSAQCGPGEPVVIDTVSMHAARTAAFSAAVATDADPAVPPHELLGVDAAERDPVRIVEAAQIRLRSLLASQGSEVALTREVCRLIRRARDHLLESLQARTAGEG